MDNVRYTPGPWVIKGPCLYAIMGTRGLNRVAEAATVEDARRIGACVNSHDALLAALKLAAQVLEDDLNLSGSNPDDAGKALTAVNAAIAQAEGGKS